HLGELAVTLHKPVLSIEMIDADRQFIQEPSDVLLLRNIDKTAEGSDLLIAWVREGSGKVECPYVAVPPLQRNYDFQILATLLGSIEFLTKILTSSWVSIKARTEERKRLLQRDSENSPKLVIAIYNPC